MKTISSDNAGPVLFLEELRFQYFQAGAAIERLEKAADSRLHRDPSKWTPPRDLQSLSTSFLSAASIISKILFEGTRKGIILKRCRALRALLEIKDCPHLRNLAIRNSFEHIDERIDEKFSQHDGADFRVAFFSDSPGPSKPGTIVFRRFDPTAFSISSLGNEINLRELMREIEEVEAKTHLAIQKLEDGVFRLWDS